MEEGGGGEKGSNEWMKEEGVGAEWRGAEKCKNI